MELIKAAIKFATEAHGDQVYGDSLPYTKHLGDVDAALIRFGFEHYPTLRVAAWLHDTVEDTSTTVDDIVMAFGDGVAELVYAVSNEPGKNRRERHQMTYPKIQTTQDAIVLKLADRIANVEFSIAMATAKGKSLFQMYRKEYLGFRTALKFNCKTFYTKQVGAMWDHLDNLMNTVV